MPPLSQQLPDLLGRAGQRDGTEPVEQRVVEHPRFHSGQVCSDAKVHAVAEGKMLRRLRPLYLVEVLSHRHLRYASGFLHLVLLGASIALVQHGGLYAVGLGLQLGVLLAALAGVGLPRYYTLVTWATLVALWNYVRRGVPTTWDAPEGTR